MEAIRLSRMSRKFHKATTNVRRCCTFRHQQSSAICLAFETITEEDFHLRRILTAVATATNFQEDSKAIKNFLIRLEASTKGTKSSTHQSSEQFSCFCLLTFSPWHRKGIYARIIEGEICQRRNDALFS
jgi:hypothetical protein